MSKNAKKAPALPGSNRKVGGKQRASKTTKTQNTKENLTIRKVTKPLFGITFLILKVSFLIAGVALWQLPRVDFVTLLPLYQIVGSIILLFLVYLELYEYFVDRATVLEAKESEPRSALSSFKLFYENVPVKK
jgi:hypothetical protein